MLLSACAGAAQDAKKPVAVAAKPAVKTVPPEEPIVPKLKPKTPKRAPASPKLVEADPSATTPPEALPAGTDAHQLLIGQQSNTDEAKDRDDTGTDLAALPPPEVMTAEPEPIAPSASTPDELKSKAEAEVATLLGRPITTRREGTGTIWTYRAGTCSLDVYFFLDVADNQRRALSYEVLPEGADDAAIQSCYKALKEAHHVP